MEILVRDYRGDIEDSFHPGIITIADYKGNILYSIGDSKRYVFARSSAKPIQAMSVLQSGAYEEYGIEPDELALMCASHSGETIHEEGVMSILNKAGLDESYLKCGVHMPFNRERSNFFIKNAIEAKEIHCNCSGKHAGMLITGKKLGYSLDDYYKPDHPIQKKIIENLAYVCEIDEENIKLSLDGCGVPVHAMPMKNWALGFARFAKASVFPEETEKLIEKITSAMTSYPEMVGGKDRICTDLMEAFGDRIFAKAGANAFYAIGVKDLGLGIVIKMLDGSSNNLPMVILDCLNKLEIISKEEKENFKEIHRDNNIYNHRKEIVGYKELAYNLEEYKK